MKKEIAMLLMLAFVVLAVSVVANYPRDTGHPS